MNRFARVAVLAIAAVVLTTAGVALAAELKSPVEILSALSGQPVEDLQNQRQEGKPYGAIAEDYDKQEEFRQQMLEQKKAVLEKRVEEGYLTREQADEIEERLGAFCNGEGGRGFCGQGLGAGFGMGYGGDRNGQGRGLGRGRGMGFGR
ncbi:MAG: DUF2680 domain-containing protein [Bacillota bacterium]|nr:DUF2680 domain-containing protein [Bacillota bacterium]MDD3298540.1 DUF2680 domain-containing protein [Bacillota bacterium]MDD3851491.1 DUF2680 domain-containing protein [Bacillota bacterium]MDD4708107.1 DUF2680 domain-containing protein [Bacillota bacterium]